MIGTVNYLKLNNLVVFQSIMRCVPGVGLYFSSLHWLKTTFSDGDPGPLAAITLGMVARTITGITMIPITVIKTRYEVNKYKTFILKTHLMSLYLINLLPGHIFKPRNINILSTYTKLSIDFYKVAKRLKTEFS